MYSFVLSRAAPRNSSTIKDVPSLAKPTTPSLYKLNMTVHPFYVKTIVSSLNPKEKCAFEQEYKDFLFSELTLRRNLPMH